MNDASAGTAHSVEIVAHRGTGKNYQVPVALQAYRPAAPPENTLPAFQWGWSRGHTCELDVFLTSDGHVIVIHDDTTGRTCNRDLVVAESTLAELKTLDAGGKQGNVWTGVRLPTLQEVLEVIPPLGRLYVELKQGPGLVDPLLSVVDQAGKGPDQIVFISFDIDSCRAIKKLRPEYAVYWILVFEVDADGVWRAGYDVTAQNNLTFVTVWQKPVDYAELLKLAREAQVDGLDVSYQQPDDFAAAMRQAGMPWGCWTVDDANIATELVRKGAFQLTTNCHDDMRVVVGADAAAAGRA